VRATVTSTATGDVLFRSAYVVRIRDGRLGFCVWSRDADPVLTEPRVTLTSPHVELRGVADAVRSGSAYEEVRGRTRAARNPLGRVVLRRRRPAAVVLVSPAG